MEQFTKYLLSIVDSPNIAMTCWYLTGLTLNIVYFFYLGINGGGLEKSIKYDIFRSDASFKLFIVFFLFIMRFPAIAAGMVNQGETLWIAGANALLKDPLYWYSYGEGSIHVFPLLMLKLLFQEMSFYSSKFLSIAFCAFSAILIYESFNCFFEKKISRLLLFPLIACFASLTLGDLIFYNSEQTVSLLLSIAIYLFCKHEVKSGHKYSYALIYGLGCVLGSIPLAMLQATLIPLFFGGYLFINLFRSNLKKAIYIVIGVFTPITFIFLVVFAAGILQDFVTRFFLMRLEYKYDTILNPYKFFDIPFSINDLKYFFFFQFLVICLIGLAHIHGLIIYYRRSIEYKATMGSILILAATYIIVANSYGGFKHYLFLLIIPVAFCYGMNLGNFMQHFLIKKTSIKFFLLLSLFIAFYSATVPLLSNLVQFNESFKVYLEKESGNSIPLHLDEKTVVAHIIRKLTKDEGTMAVWGSAPEYFVYSQMPSATRDLTTDVLFNGNSLSRYFEKCYLKDLQRNKPIIILDAVITKDFASSDKNKKGLGAVPSIYNYVKGNYTLIADLFGTFIYFRNDKIHELNFRKIDLPQRNPRLEKTSYAYHFSQTMQKDTLYIDGWILSEQFRKKRDTPKFLVFESEKFLSIQNLKATEKPEFKMMEIDERYINSAVVLDYSNAHLPLALYKLGILENYNGNLYKIMSKDSILKSATDFKTFESKNYIQYSYVSNIVGESLLKSLNIQVDSTGYKIKHGFGLNDDLDFFYLPYGWAYIKNMDSKKTKIYFQLISDKDSVLFDTKISKLDPNLLPEGHEGLKYDNSSFTLSVDKRKLLPGTYYLNMILINYGEETKGYMIKYTYKVEVNLEHWLRGIVQKIKK